MGTFTCSDCYNLVSLSAYSCPHCGNTRVREQINMQEWRAEVAKREEIQLLDEKDRAKKYYNGNVDEMRKVEKIVADAMKKREKTLRYKVLIRQFRETSINSTITRQWQLKNILNFDI